MKRLLLALLASALATPSVAQHHGHHMPGHTMPAPKAKPASKKPAPKPAARKTVPKAKPAATAKPAAKKAASKKTVPRKASPKPPTRRPATTKPNPHAGHTLPTQSAQQPDPHAGHHMPAPASPPAAGPHAGHAKPAAPAQADPHAGHHMPAPASPPAAEPHAGHAMPAAPAQVDPHAGHHMPEAPPPPLAPPPPGALSGPAHAADAVFGTEHMAAAREAMRREHGEMITYKVLIDQLEARIRGGRDGYQWDAQAWIGGDVDKFWLKTEGEGEFGGHVEGAELQALWSHAIDPWFDLQGGIRHDFRPDPERTHFVIGVQGLAPYWFEVDAAAFVSTKGDVTARMEAEYDLRLTQKLILQPRAELDLAVQDVPELGIGSGLSTGEIGARLRYEIRPEFAPYVGVEYERAFGDTADFRRSEGEKAGGWNFLLGLRTWF